MDTTVKPANVVATSAYRTARELVEMLAKRRIGSLELVEESIARIEAIDPSINAVVVRDFDRARCAAAEADRAIDSGDRRPLLGLPMTVKESFSVAGLPTSWGDCDFADWMPPAASLAVERLQAAGAIILGKTNIPFRLGDLQSHNPVHGVTNNPWDLSRTCGGSSGGSAAALAAGYVSLELGSDFAGSLRVPAHNCGIYAHRPSLDLIPTRGGGPPLAPSRPDRGDFSVYGPMARSAADLALGLDVLAGPDPLGDGIGYALALPPSRHDRLRDFRVLLLDEHPLYPVSTAVKEAFEQFGAGLVREGCRVERSSPQLPDLAAVAQCYYELLGAFLSEGMSPEVQQRVVDHLAAIDPAAASLELSRMRGSVMSHRAWLFTTRKRKQLAEEWRTLMRTFDVVICPVTPTVAIKHDPHRTFLQDFAPDRTVHMIDVDGVPRSYDDQLVWLTTSALLGIPATAAPIGISAGGLPIGAEFMGGFLDDRTTIRFAELAEAAFGGFVVPPRLRSGSVG